MTGGGDDRRGGQTPVIYGLLPIEIVGRAGDALAGLRHLPIACPSQFSGKICG
jgi:hypothetical protein